MCRAVRPGVGPSSSSGSGGSGGVRQERPRQAVPGMIEALLLTSLAVTIVGMLAVWMGALDEDAWRISGYGAHCTLNIVLFEDVGGGRNFLDVNVVNSGRQDIHGVSIMNGDAVMSSSSVVLVPGNRTAEFVGPNTPVENLEALATYEDGSTSICKKSYNAGVH